MILYQVTHLTSDPHLQTKYYNRLHCENIMHILTCMLPHLDLTSLTDVEHRFVDLIKWEDENRVKRELRMYSKIAHKWRQIATQLGFELGEIDSIRKNYPFDDHD